MLASPTKYAVQWTYNLTIYNLEASDAGLYRCTAGGKDYDAVLTVIGTSYCFFFFFFFFFSECLTLTMLLADSSDGKHMMRPSGGGGFPVPLFS